MKTGPLIFEVQLFHHMWNHHLKFDVCPWNIEPRSLWTLCFNRCEKIVHPEIKIQSSFIHPHVNLYKDRQIFWECLCGFVRTQWKSTEAIVWSRVFLRISSSAFHRWKNVIRVWNDMRVNKLSNFHFWVHYHYNGSDLIKPSKSIPHWTKCTLCTFIFVSALMCITKTEILTIARICFQEIANIWGREKTKLEKRHVW